VICQQLQKLQQDFAALVMAAENQEQLSERAILAGATPENISTFRELLQARMDQIGQALSAHVDAHNCAN